MKGLRFKGVEISPHEGEKIRCRPSSFMTTRPPGAPSSWRDYTSYHGNPPACFCPANSNCSYWRWSSYHHGVSPPRGGRHRWCQSDLKSILTSPATHQWFGLRYRCTFRRPSPSSSHRDQLCRKGAKGDEDRTRPSGGGGWGVL